MKTSSFIITLPAFVLAAAISTNFSHAQTTASLVPVSNAGQPTLQMGTYQVTERDGNSRVWQKTDYETLPSGKTVPRVHQYTELATGLNYQQNGQWVASKEEIDVLADGTVAATQGQHQAYFPVDIAQGVIELDTPDGLKLQSRPIGLSYDDGSKTVLVAMLTNSVGELAGSNVVIYPEAFVGLKADLRYTYRKSGFEQDIVFRQQPPPPEAYGLNPQTARLQVLTEFFNAPEPVPTQGLADQKRGLQDNLLSFGVMKMARGKASSTVNSAQKVRREIPVYKSWQHVDGRTFLVEELAYEEIEPQLGALPVAAIKGNPSMSSRQPVLQQVTSRRWLTPRRWVQTGSKTVARADMAREEGVVLDYVVINANLGSYTFQGDTTYYVSGDFSASGALTFEGGAVIKQDFNGEIDVTYSGSIICNGGPYRPTIFTSINDDSVGEVITNSSGMPSVGDVNTFLSVDILFGLTLHDMRFSYCNLGLNQYDGQIYSTMSISDCQFANVDIAILGGYVTLENVLFAGSQEDWAVAFSGVGNNALNAENVTADGFSIFAQSLGYQGWWPSGEVPIVTLNNCLITCYNIADWGGYWGSLVTNATAFLPYPTSPVYQPVGGGNYYLADNTYRNAGTTNISPQLLAALRQKTTYPPMVYSNTTISADQPLTQQAPRDTESPGPDVGYHYDPMDYVFGGVVVTNATVAVSPGTVLGVFGADSGGYYTYGLSIGSGGQLICDGTAANLNRIVTYNTVQEDPGTDWQVPTIASLTDYLGGEGGEFDIRFTDWSLIGTPHDLHLLVAQCNPVNLRDCQFHSGGLSTFLGPTINLTNCLFERVYLSLYPDDANTTVLGNNLFYGGTLDLLPFGSWQAVVRDNLFDKTTILDHSVSYTYTGGYNAYMYGQNRMQPTSTNDLVVNARTFPYQTGLLGNYYQPANSPLIDKGSESVEDAGLTGYTILTNQTPDTGTVDIGYHYKITGNDSTGTDFWLAFFSIEAQGEQYLPVDQSLYISSPVAASGTVTYPVNGPVLTITGDPAVNGTYILTNMPASETNDFIGSTMYMNEANTNLQVVPMQFAVWHYYWAIWSYDPNNGYRTTYYYKIDPYLNGTNWVPYYGTSADLVISCPQVPFSQPFSVAAGTVTNLPLPQDTMLYQFDTIEHKGIHVTTSQPVSVYGFDYNPQASTAFTAYPTPMLGTNYCLMSRASQDLDFFGSADTYYSQFAIVGTVANTTVTITPSATANLAGSMWTNSFILNQGNTYQINSSNCYGDVTGTWISSDKPIAVFAGDNLAYVPDGRTGAGNPLVQEQLPVEDWGMNVVGLGFAGRTNGDTYRILAAYSNTVATISGVVVSGYPGSITTNYEVVVTNLAAGQYYETILEGPAQFQSTKPIQVAQFANGAQLSDPINQEGDPCEILLPPTGHWMNSYTVYTSTNDYFTRDFDQNYLNIIVAQSATNTTTVDGSLVSATNFLPILNTGYYGAQLAITNSGPHTVSSSQPIEVQAYGFGITDAYSYLGGLIK